MPHRIKSLNVYYFVNRSFQFTLTAKAVTKFSLKTKEYSTMEIGRLYTLALETFKTFKFKHFKHFDL